MRIDLCIIFSLAECTSDVKPIGTFYSLQAAYDEGLLTVDDLQNIADYLNNNIEYPETLDADIEKAIKEKKAENIRTCASNPHKEAAESDVSIVGYYGTYNDCVAVRLNDSFSDFPDVVREVTIAGVTFVYSGAFITIWKAGK